MRENTGNILLLFFAVIFLIAAEWNSGVKEVYRAVADETGLQKIQMTAGNYFFRPNYIVVKVNVPVEISIRREGIIPHRFILKSPEAGIDLRTELGTEPVTVRFIPKTEGEYAFYCDGGLIESHREKGMQGVLQVTRSGGSVF